MTDEKKSEVPEIKKPDIEIADDSNERFKEFRESLNEEQLKKFEEFSVSVSESKISYESEMFSGPLPPPEVINRFNQIIPDGAERIMKMAEKQLDHRIDMESTTVKSQLDLSKSGQRYGLIISIGGLISAITLGYLGYGKVAGIAVVLSLGTVATAFILGKFPEIRNKILPSKQKSKQPKKE